MPRTASHQQPSGILPAAGELAAKISSGPAYGRLQLRYKLYHNIAARDYLSPCYGFASAAMKMTIALVASLLTVVAARHVLQSTTARVTFYDNSHYSGGGQAFDAAVPATGCGPCTDLNFVSTNSWESYTSNAGTTIRLYDNHYCQGKDSGPLPAKEGMITGSLSDSVDSFRVCA